MTNTEIRPFRVDVPQARLDELNAKLDAATWPAPLPGDDWDTGVPVAWLRGLAEYLRHSYDWRAAEAELNAHPQFTTEIDGQNIHFLHVRSTRADATPLLLTHGWPGSVVEFLDVIPLLRDDFHLVIPSLPGFAFSGPVGEAGWTPDRIARAWITLMERLGYERFGVQGGDIGGAVSPEVARIAPGRVIGVHTNGGPGPMPPLPMPEDELASLTDVERDRVARIEAFMQEEFGYIAIQSTRPQALAYGLVDSPIGLLAWLMDKFREWTHPRATVPDEILGRDRLLTNWMLYWATGTAGSAAFVGYAQNGPWGPPKMNSGVPTAALVLAHDVAIRRYAETENTIVRWTDVDRGGHFAALEEPELLAGDVREFFAGLK
ncbi:epoxide hydrolase family protein [Phytomonospora endophytica]|uniref:Pimeloyl-ACP methyl ester carboxylesterase n=1 Tax=Phytomonospora endophytica TaxID=714109 RepID=A0A841G793_9ACTN|nr:epoxide hydrolase family protein [Phytomonospora endophytica]MBB6039940.1 pimeloyl-ACP methyl ester carboxylesterase [Phytomonospora endophytica]GIG70989.1 microsomal epoxide hydrolase [Phytomonospora endophytica]